MALQTNEFKKMWFLEYRTIKGEIFTDVFETYGELKRVIKRSMPPGSALLSIKKYTMQPKEIIFNNKKMNSYTTKDIQVIFQNVR